MSDVDAISTPCPLPRGSRHAKHDLPASNFAHRFLGPRCASAAAAGPCGPSNGPTARRLVMNVFSFVHPSSFRLYPFRWSASMGPFAGAIHGTPRHHAAPSMTPSLRLSSAQRSTRWLVAQCLLGFRRRGDRFLPATSIHRRSKGATSSRIATMLTPAQRAGWVPPRRLRAVGWQSPCLVRCPHSDPIGNVHQRLRFSSYSNTLANRSITSERRVRSPVRNSSSVVGATPTRCAILGTESRLS